ncbi:MAG: hypothetical protein JNJ88_10555 [Planctomycetes bacterium]|nr:hypothetical protein [Planctomycetota bacterium]
MTTRSLTFLAASSILALVGFVSCAQSTSAPEGTSNASVAAPAPKKGSCCASEAAVNAAVSEKAGTEKAGKECCADKGAMECSAEATKSAAKGECPMSGSSCTEKGEKGSN